MSGLDLNIQKRLFEKKAFESHRKNTSLVLALRFFETLTIIYQNGREPDESMNSIIGQHCQASFIDRHLIIHGTENKIL